MTDYTPEESAAQLAVPELEQLAAEARRKRESLAGIEEKLTVAVAHLRQAADRYYTDNGHRNPILDAPVSAALAGLPDLPEGIGAHGEGHRRPHPALIAKYHEELKQRI